MVAGQVHAGQESKNPSQTLLRAPSTIGQSLKETDKAIGGKSTETPPAKSAAVPGLAETDKKGADPAVKLSDTPTVRRDPFRPFNLTVRSNVRRRENLSPLESYELGQLKLVGIILDAKEPRAMVEDSAGLGYVVKIGTPIGAGDGVVKAIRQNEIVIEEFFVDLYGARKRRDVNMRISAETAE